MKKIKYFLEFLVISFLFFIYKILGLKKASFISGKIFELFGPLFRSKQIIKSNILRAIPEINTEGINHIKKNHSAKSFKNTFEAAFDKIINI